MTRQYIQNLLQREFFSPESLVGMFAVRPVSGFPVCKYRQDMADQHIVRRNQPFQFRFGQFHEAPVIVFRQVLAAQYPVLVRLVKTNRYVLKVQRLETDVILEWLDGFQPAGLCLSPLF